MPEKMWGHLVEAVPNSINVETVEAFLQHAGSCAYKLVAVVPKVRGAHLVLLHPRGRFCSGPPPEKALVVIG